MRIESINCHFSGQYMLVSVGTDNGLTGVGEAGIWAYPEAALAVIDGIRGAVHGFDPLKRELLFQLVMRQSHFRGSALSAALSALDIACWDIAGKYFDAPVHVLMGGAIRDRVRLYTHVSGDTADELAVAAAAAASDGFTAVRFDPFKPGWLNLSHASMVEYVADKVGTVRRAVGESVDLCIECHFKLGKAGFRAVSDALTEYRPLFIEDPLPPESVTSLGDVSGPGAAPIATGERLTSIGEFADLVRSAQISYVRPDVCVVGGITQAVKVASLAEAYHIGVIPHNWLSPVCTAASVHLDACMPNFTIQEFTSDTSPDKAAFVPRPIERDGGYLRIPREPGLGIEVRLAAMEAAPAVQRSYAAAPSWPDGAPADF